IAFHFFALITSYAQIKIFNYNSPRTEEFWPFVSFFREKYNNINPLAMEPGKTISEMAEMKLFNGIFFNYDWSEFSIYIAGAIFFFLYLKIKNNVG
ncbi:MAG: hypothetical protein Q8R57_04095, partial [Bacteroidota bacterium]|nr:hypothetical protein [Bacteroidota bacterium]